ncbi:hypothetical protein DM860_006259 [Cuscuta australis]|uniref:Protein MULTIPLE CHLOROPLAST DIVISION SITE 1 n=1 Tax=Cuscuta australis TaxID=267555 RepID=A0A328DK27_9ASTE|nr:hypothetical protein DM860_006259 [Cuscuta australis]
MTKMASIGTLYLRAPSLIPLRSSLDELRFRSDLGVAFNYTKWNIRVTCRKFGVRAVGSDEQGRLSKDAVVIVKYEKDDAEKPRQNVVAKLKESIDSLPVFVFSATGKLSGTHLTIGLCFLATMLVIVVRGLTTRKSSYSRPGSVADLVRRGQLRSERRGISTPLKYEDPFNNPMVKVSKSNSTVEMCGKVYRLAPVTLTDELQTVHKKRRSRAYQWKRPTMFLKEGESIPPDVDPDTVRWIPANHPFATTSSDIDADLAQNNVYQKHGVPSRVQAEHEALQRKLEELQNDQKIEKLVIDPAASRDLERSQIKSDSREEDNGTSINPTTGPNSPPLSDHVNKPLGHKPLPEELQKP